MELWLLRGARMHPQPSNRNHWTAMWDGRQSDKVVIASPPIEVVLLCLSTSTALTLSSVQVAAQATHLPVINIAFHCFLLTL
jgi:hypothetical protein